VPRRSVNRGDGGSDGGEFGEIDILVNNAAKFASFRGEPMSEIAIDRWDRTTGVHTLSPLGETSTINNTWYVTGRQARRSGTSIAAEMLRAIAEAHAV